ncbi:MAG TPA: rod shape-determining protein [Oscillospiraceae bacterium]|nr:rod shape-determining protein [Oscillospiraceae bacterium]
MSAIDLGIDLGTANIIVYIDGKGIVLNEPSVVAYNSKTKQVIAVGDDAFKMIGRTPEYISAIRPLENGVVSDNSMTESMIKEFLRKVSGRFLIKPRVILCVPSFITEVESRAVIDAALKAGARKVYLIQEPIAAMIGAGIDISKPDGNMIVDIGGGTTDVAVISMNGIVKSKSIKVAGNKLDEAITQYMLNTYKIQIGSKTAEQTKVELANVYRPDGSKSMLVKGRHVLEGMPRQVEITNLDVYRAVMNPVNQILAAIKEVFEVTPPELISDIITNGIHLTGGGALLKGLAQLISDTTNAPCVIAKDPLYCVARGTGLAFKKISTLLDGFEAISMYNH